jgi:HD superfamily phosphohydrolase
MDTSIYKDDVIRVVQNFSQEIITRLTDILTKSENIDLSETEIKNLLHLFDLELLRSGQSVLRSLDTELLLRGSK